MEQMLIFLLLIQGAICGGFCGYLAGQRNRNDFSWFWLGFFFSFFALIAIAASPSLAKQRFGTAADESSRQCPFCAETVMAEAKICRFCQHELPPLAATKNTDQGEQKHTILSSRKWKCGVCSALNESFESNCRNCTTGFTN